MLPDAAASPDIRVFEPDSLRLLATGQHMGPCEAAVHPFGCLEGNGVLLAYYFGKGKRDVCVQIGENEGVMAHLGTRWRAGHREWTLDW
ncbi:MAG: hypothetical protein AB7J35_11520 [Dehalococcoidia bacterium]